MGWISIHLDNSESVKDWFKSEYSDKTKFEVLDIAIVQRTTLYAAVKNVEYNFVYCAVYLLSYNKHEYCNFSYKNISEFSGPVQYHCPKRIMNLLTPLDKWPYIDQIKYAVNWRKKVMEYWEKRDSIKKLPKTYIFKTENPVKFSNGNNYSFFEKNGKYTFAGNFNDGVFKRDVRVRFNLTNIKFEIIK